MRPIDVPTHTNLGPALREKRFRLDDASTAHLVGLLTNQYSDTLLAGLRELSTNAADSHISARYSGPIRVTLPSSAKPFLVVEDFGLGMGIDTLLDRYTGYGASDKRENDEVNGTFGIGSKAPLAYTDTFTIQSRHDGVQVLAVVAKDSDGVPVIRILDTSTTDKPNGVRIEVPIRERDFHRLADKADEFFQYWAKGTVLVNGQEPRSIRDDESLIWLDDDVAVSLRHHDSVLVQHNVAYPVERYSNYNALRNLGYAVIAFVPTGTVKPAPSREALEYTDRTNDVLSILADYVKDSFHRVIRARIEEATTTYERLVLVNQWRQHVPQVVQDFFGKSRNGLTVSIGQHGFGWRYRPTAYKNKGSKVEWVRAHDVIGEWPIIVGYDLKTLTEKAKAKVDVFFAETDHQEFLLLPTGTDLSVAEGRKNIVTWAEIDAAVPDAKVRPASGGGYKGQTQYTVWVGGTAYNYVLRDAKEFYLGDGALVAYTEHGDGHLLSSRMPDVVIFDIGSRQVDKIVRETGAVNAWGVWERRRKAALEALTDDDRLYATVRATSSDFEAFAEVVEQIQDPDLVTFLRAVARKHETASVTLQAYLNLGGTLRDIPHGDLSDNAFLARYPLVRDVYYVRRNLADLVLYINAKWAAIQPTLNPAKEQS